MNKTPVPSEDGTRRWVRCLTSGREADARPEFRPIECASVRYERLKERAFHVVFLLACGLKPLTAQKSACPISMWYQAMGKMLNIRSGGRRAAGILTD